MSCSACIRKRAGRGLHAAVLAVLAIGPPRAAEAAMLPAEDGTSAALCAEAIRIAEATYRLPPGLLAAMGEVESGRVDQASGRIKPWPWTVQAGDQSLTFGNKGQAVEWVREATARGITSIDTGCLQVNLQFHPRAFDSLDDAFDPRRNVDYAARFLVRLHGMTGDWKQATGFYHSQTQALALAYETRVERRLNGPSPWPRGFSRPPGPPTRLAGLSAAWQATLAQPRADGEGATEAVSNGGGAATRENRPRFTEDRVAMIASRRTLSP